jgi:KUP system potassium uptake protein
MPRSNIGSTPTAAVPTPAVAARPAGPALLLGTLGVVFGNIRTSPIYAFRETLRAAGAKGSAAGALPCTVFSVASPVFWAAVQMVAAERNVGSADPCGRAGHAG